MLALYLNTDIKQLEHYRVYTDKHTNNLQTGETTQITVDRVLYTSLQINLSTFAILTSLTPCTKRPTEQISHLAPIMFSVDT